MRKRILIASEGMVVRGHALWDWLYIPEVLTASRRDEIAERRAAYWMRSPRTRNTDHPLWLMLGELKDLSAPRRGFRAVIKHVPDLPFATSGELYEWVKRRFANELSLWGTGGDMHLVVRATFAREQESRPTIKELTLMPTAAQWIPVEDTFDLQLVERLLKSGKRFRKAFATTTQHAVPCPGQLFSTRKGRLTTLTRSEAKG